jgi:hypothetical protein
MEEPRTSWTEISTYRQCPHKHQLQYVEGWKEPVLSKPLATGILWHKVLEHHYRGVQSGDMIPSLEAIIALLDEFGARDDQDDTHEIAGKLAWMYDGYRERWAAEDQQWEIISIEGEFKVKLPSGVDLVGRYDLLVRLMKRYVWVVDHKGNKNLPDGKELDLDDQMPLYIKGVREATGLPIRGAIYNVARTDKLVRPMTMDERFKRYLMFRTDYELDRVWEEADATAQRAKDPNDARERHTDPQTCKWRCPYTEACLGGRKAAHLERQLLLAKGFIRRADRPKPTAVPDSA